MCTRNCKISRDAGVACPEPRQTSGEHTGRTQTSHSQTSPGEVRYESAASVNVANPT